ncbi:MAG: DeoR/GlpR family DNA-binding transcription regulator [Sporolactobacillus sp.]
MLAEERQQRIMQKLEEQKVVKVQDLVRYLDASESTIRRDLQDMESRHLLRRLHGGASLLQLRSEELDMEAKTAKNIQEKKKIAYFAYQQIKPHECIYLDAGTTTLEMIRYFRDTNVTVVTNSPVHAEKLTTQGVDCYLIGGFMKRTTQAVVGSMALSNISQFRFDRAFIGTNGIDAAFGYTTPDPEEASIKRSACELAAQAYIVADSSKFSEIAFCKMFDLAQAAIITNESLECIAPIICEKTKIYSVDSVTYDQPLDGYSKK